MKQNSIPTCTVTFPEKYQKEKHQCDIQKVNYYQEKQSTKGNWCKNQSYFSKMKQDISLQIHHVESKHEVIIYDSFDEQLELLGNNLGGSMQKTNCRMIYF